MDVRAVIALLRARAVLASRDRWTREELLVHQSHALAELRAWQVVEETDGVLVLLVQPTDRVVDADVATSVRAALRSQHESSSRDLHQPSMSSGE